MPVILRLETKSPLLEPNVIEVDGKELRVKEITLGALEKVQALVPLLNSGDAKAIKEALGMLLEGETSVLWDLPLSKLGPLVATLMRRATEPSDEEKKGSGPGSD